MFAKIHKPSKRLKKSPELMKPYEKRVYFFDEMRYGTRTDHKRRWTRQGRRPICQMKIGYQWAYLYVAICPFSGDLFSMLYPNMKKEGFTYFTQELAKHRGEKTLKAQQKVLLIGDRATSHQARLLPEGIEWEALPTAAPELNPVERFFKELRKTLANRVFQNIKEVEKTLIFHLEKWRQQPQKIQQLTLFPYIRQD